MANAPLPNLAESPKQNTISGIAPANAPPSSLQRLGMIVLVLGVAGLVVSGILRFVRPTEAADGALPACALILVIFGLTLCFPTLLQDGTSSEGGPNVSTMRVAVLAIVAVFALVTVKAAWATTSLAELKMDASWAWVLAAALGSKAAQSFAENTSPK